MKLLKLYLGAFGQFEDFTLEFSEGFNLVYGLNESGKTTIHAFIEGMLYGFYRRGVKRKLYSDQHDQYQPKDKSAYYGHLVLKTKEQTLRIERNFDKDKSQLKVINENTGQDITSRLDNHPIYQEADIAKLIDLPYHLFKNTLSIAQNQMHTDKEAEGDLTTRLENLSSAGSEAFSPKKALALLEEKKQAIGSTHARTKPYALALKAKADLEEEYDDASKKHEHVLKLHQKIAALQADKTAISNDINALTKTIEAQENTRRRKLYDEIETIKKQVQSLLKNARETPIQPSINDLFQVKTDYQELFEQLPEQTTQALRAKDRSDTLNEQRPDDSEMISPDSYQTVLADQAKLAEFEATIDNEKKAALEDAYKEFKTLNQAIIKKHTRQKTSRFYTRIIGYPLLLFTAVLLFINLSYPLQLIALSPFIIGLLLELIFVWRLKQSCYWKETRSAQVKKVAASLDKETNKQAIASREIDKLYQKHSVQNQEQFRDKLYDAKRQKENYDRDKELIEATLNHQKTYNAILKTYTPLFEFFSLTPSLNHLELLLKIHRHIETIEHTLHGQNYDALQQSIDFSLASVDTLDLNDNQAKRERLDKQIKALEETMQKARAEASSEAKHYRDIALIEADLDQQNEKITTLKRRLDILETAIKRLKEAQDKQEENFAPILSEAIATYLPKLTLDRYHDIKLRRNLEAKIFTAQSKRLEDETFFSKGTVDQIHFAIRLGIIEAIQKQAQCLLLDDAFVNFDHDRLKQALKLLSTLKKTQIMLFTCHKREKTLLDSLDIDYRFQTLLSD